MFAIRCICLVSVIVLSKAQRNVFKQLLDGVTFSRTARLPLNETRPIYLNDSDRLHDVSDNSLKQAIRKAANYVLEARQSDGSWGTSTARAVVALMFAREFRPLDENEIYLMKKQLTIQLHLDLLKEQKMSLSRLALSINALYAMCEDPRNFQGMDLVKLLRTETDTSKSNSRSPLVFLTLCIAGESEYNDLQKLSRMFAIPGSDRLGYKALAFLALTCILRSGKDFTRTSSLAERLETSERILFSEFPNLEDSSIDIYNKALLIQAANCARKRTRSAKLLDVQLSNGSFGDLLATYYTIPALLGTSLLDLKCKKSDFLSGEDSLNELMKPGKNVSISVWITTNGVLNSHSLGLKFGEEDTLFNVMKKAETLDSTIRFMWDRTAKGLEVYSLSGIPNDAEAGKSWTLYSGRSDRVKVNSKDNLKQESGIELKPQEDHTYIFWWKN